MKKLLNISLFFSLLLPLSQAFAGIGLIPSYNEDKFYDFQAVAEATRGGIIKSKGKKSEGFEQRLVCVDELAQTLEDCDQFRFALLREEKIVNDQVMVQLNFHQYAPELTQSDLASMDTLLEALKKTNPKFKPHLHTFSQTMFISVFIMVAPLWGPQDRPVIVDFLLLPVSLSVGVASVPVTATIGAVRSFVVQNKMNKFLNSLVENDRGVLVKFDHMNFSESTFRN